MKIFDLTIAKEQRTGENYIMTSFVICPLDLILLELLNRNEETDGTFHTFMKMR
jgi:hypothetical protein